MEIRFHLDEHIDAAIANGLRQRGIDSTTTADAGLLQATDEEHLAYALAEGRVVVTHDDDFLELHSRGIPHAGIAYCHMHARTIGQIIRGLVLVHQCLTAEEMRNEVEFL